MKHNHSLEPPPLYSHAHLNIKEGYQQNRKIMKMQIYYFVSIYTYTYNHIHIETLKLN